MQNKKAKKQTNFQNNKQSNKSNTTKFTQYSNKGNLVQNKLISSVIQMDII